MPAETRVQKEIVPDLRLRNPELAEQLNALEIEAQRIFRAYYGTELPEIPPAHSSLSEFLKFLWHTSAAKPGRANLGIGRPSSGLKDS